MAEKLRSHQSVLNLLMNHEIGFHSSAHSVRPTVFEYCDVEGYEDAVRLSVERETSHINPITGEVEQSGGICALRSLFPSKRILAYRAPGYCCPPPHLKAMSRLGFKYDFSWDFSRDPLFYKGVTFYPRPIFMCCETALLVGSQKVDSWKKLLRSIFTARMTVLNFHPNLFVNAGFWDSIYHGGNPIKLSGVPCKDDWQTRRMFAMLEVLLGITSCMEKLRVVDTSPLLSVSKTILDVNKIDVGAVVEAFSYWPNTFFSYKPKYILSQLSTFFNCSLNSDDTVAVEIIRSA